MTILHHTLEVYEPYDYTGDNPLSVSGLAVIAGPMRDNYYLLQLDHPLVIDDDNVTQLLVQPRYSDDKIDRAVSSTCTVNIARIVNGHDPMTLDKLAFDDFARWGVGKIHPPG